MKRVYNNGEYEYVFSIVSVKESNEIGKIFPECKKSNLLFVDANINTNSSVNAFSFTYINPYRLIGECQEDVPSLSYASQKEFWIKLLTEKILNLHEIIKFPKQIIIPAKNVFAVKEVSADEMAERIYDALIKQ